MAVAARRLIVAGAIERDGEIRLRVVNDVRRHTLKKFVTENVDLEGADAIYSDKLQSYVGIHPNHASVNHSEEEWVRGDVHTQTVEGVWSLLKRSIIGSYHQLSARHLGAYLDEMEWRFNNRDNPYLFRDTMDALIHSENLTYQDLVIDSQPVIHALLHTKLRRCYVLQHPLDIIVHSQCSDRIG